jgi:hypothetical protein
VANPSLEYRDLTDIPAERREAEAMRLTQEFIRIPFNLSSAGLLSGIGLLKLGDAHHLLVFSMQPHRVRRVVSQGVLRRVLDLLSAID